MFLPTTGPDQGQRRNRGLEQSGIGRDPHPPPPPPSSSSFFFFFFFSFFCSMAENGQIRSAPSALPYSFSPPGEGGRRPGEGRGSRPIPLCSRPRFRRCPWSRLQPVVGKRRPSPALRAPSPSGRGVFVYLSTSLSLCRDQCPPEEGERKPDEGLPVSKAGVVENTSLQLADG